MISYIASCLFSNAVWSRLASDDVTRCSSRLLDLFGTRPNLTAGKVKRNIISLGMSIILCHELYQAPRL